MEVGSLHPASRAALISWDEVLSCRTRVPGIDKERKIGILDADARSNDQRASTKLMSATDVRWLQRFRNYTKAVRQLTRFLDKDNLNDLEQQGLIQSFEYTYELAWNTLKDFFESQGESGILGSRDAFRLAFKRGLITNGDVWMEMIRSRGLTSHTYDEALAAAIDRSIRTSYFGEFARLQACLEELSRRPE